MSWRYRGRAQVDTTRPGSFAVCDRCGIWHNHAELTFQYDFRGMQLQNLRLLVCRKCLDRPSPFYRPIIVPPDPLPIQNPRPEWFAADENNYLTTQDGDILITQDGSPLVIEGGGENVT